jgi:hypothetical protein
MESARAFLSFLPYPASRLGAPIVLPRVSITAHGLKRREA